MNPRRQSKPEERPPHIAKTSLEDAFVSLLGPQGEAA